MTRKKLRLSSIFNEVTWLDLNQCQSDRFMLQVSLDEILKTRLHSHKENSLTVMLYYSVPAWDITHSRIRYKLGFTKQDQYLKI